MGKSPFSPVYERISDQLKQARERAGLRPCDLAARSGLAASTISRMERGLAGPPNAETLMRWCLACGVEPASLWPSLAETQELL